MRFPLDPVLANPGYHGWTSWLEICCGCTIFFYRWYVDDTFCLFHSEHVSSTVMYISPPHHLQAPQLIRFDIEKIYQS